MKSKKKLLLMGVGVMGALAMGVGATSTFAWFTATNAAQVASINGTSDNVMIVKHAEADALEMQLKAVYETITATVDLTCGEAKAGDANNVAQVVGKSYVVDSNGHVKENKATITKFGTVSFTFSTTDTDIKTKDLNNAWQNSSAGDRALLNGKKYDVNVTGSDQLRVGTAHDDNGAVGASSTQTGQPIKVGELTIAATAAGVVSYSYNSIVSATNKISFYYSVSPKSYTSDSESTTESYGSFAISLSAYTGS